MRAWSPDSIATPGRHFAIRQMALAAAAAVLPFCAGAAVGVAFLVVLIVLSGASYARGTRSVAESQPSRSFRIGAFTEATCLNLILQKAFPRLARSSLLSREVAKHLSWVGRPDSVLQAINSDSIVLSVTGPSPIIDRLRLRTASGGDYIELRFRCEAQAVVGLAANVRLSVLGTLVCVGARARVRRICGTLETTIRERVGRLEVHVSRETEIDCNADAGFGEAVSVSTE